LSLCGLGVTETLELGEPQGRSIGRSQAFDETRQGARDNVRCVSLLFGCQGLHDVRAHGLLVSQCIFQIVPPTLLSVCVSD
jgi:hypothetical protein